MVQLISKIQYQNFEAGEFVEIKERSYEETISIIEAFPWTEERNNLKVDLTNPSITIVNSYNEFLKIALYYNGKFVLHYYNNSEELFTKS